MKETKFLRDAIARILRARAPLPHITGSLQTFIRPAARPVRSTIYQNGRIIRMDLVQRMRKPKSGRGRHLLITLALAAVLAVPVSATEGREIAPWTAMAREDLAAIRDIVAANHPGPVDPENRAYREWLEEGFRLASGRAEAARSYSDYARLLRFYTNGFRDGHIGVNFTLTSSSLSWPGFLVARSDADGKVRVVAHREESEIGAGAELVGCDGLSLEEIVATRQDPYFWNAGIPHERWNQLPQLFILSPADRALRQKSCTFLVDGEAREVELRWSTEPRPGVIRYLEQAVPAAPQLGMRNSSGVWFISLPSFAYSGEGAVAIRSLIEQIENRAAELRDSTIVLDVRGNGGGNSAWANLVAAALWGKPLVERSTRSFDWTVDWRVSPDNIEHLAAIVARHERDGLTGSARSWATARDAMAAAHERGEDLIRMPSPPRLTDDPLPDTPLNGRIFLLTDGRCASACLDFADLVLRLPGVTHIGFPTSADAVYMDNTYKELPSGLAGLSYSLKVYRNRIRANNEWYEPQHQWPGGELTDEAIARWIETLNAPIGESGIE
jgi:hypothetical protein